MNIENYITRISSQYKILSAEETLELFDKYERDSFELVELMFNHNILLIKKLILKAGFEIDEALSMAWVATENAVNTWDISKGAKFSTHLAWKIRGKLSNLRYHINRGDRIRDGLILDSDNFCDDVKTLHDLIPDPNAVDPSDIDEDTDKQLLYASIEKLTDKQKYVIYCMLAGKTQKAVAKDLGVTHQNISIIQKTAIKKLTKLIKCDTVNYI